jgi:hypothetical protein
MERREIKFRRRTINSSLFENNNLRKNIEK